MGLLSASSAWRWLGAVGAAVLVAVQAGPAWSDEGLDITSDITYEIRAEDGLVRVESEYELKNTLRDEDDGRYVTRFFYKTFTVPVPETAVNLAATSGTSELTIEIEESEDSSFVLAVIQLRRYIYSGQTQTINFSYDLPSEPVRSDRFARVNPAFSSFAMWADGDPGQATVRLLIPEKFSIETVGDDLSYASTPDGAAWVASDIEDPDGWYVWVAARDDSGLVSTQIKVDNRSAVIRAWPDDPAWEHFAIDQFTNRLPIMEDLIGVPWPLEGDLEIIETVTPTFYGAAGWYLTDENVIEIAEYLDEQLMLHELAHAWFSHDNFTHRWISEGLAEELSYRTLEADGEPLGPFGVFPPDSANAFPLNTWVRSVGPAVDGEDPDTYGYDASAYVLRQITREIGMDGLRSVLQAADSGQMAYPGEGEPGSLRNDWDRTDWKRFLDLAETLGDTDALSPVFERYVVTETQLPLLEERAEARAEYADLVAHGDGWAPPTVVRLAMEDWEFDRASSLMGDAAAVLAIRDTIIREAIRQGVEPSSELEYDYESAYHDVSWVIRRAESQLGALEAVADAAHAVAADRGVFAAIGLWGADLEADLAEVRATFETGADDATISLANAVLAEVDAGAGVGMKRAGLGAAGLMVVLSLGLVGHRLVRGRSALAPPSETSNSSYEWFQHPIFELEVEDFASWVPRIERDLVAAGANSSVDQTSEGVAA